MKSSFDSAVSKAEQRLQVSGWANYDGDCDDDYCFNLENVVLILYLPTTRTSSTPDRFPWHPCHLSGQYINFIKTVLGNLQNI